MEFWLEVGAKLLMYGALLLLVGALGLRWLLLPRVIPAIDMLPAGAPARASGDEAAAAVDRITLRAAVVLALALLLRAVAHTVAAFGMTEALSWENLTLIALESQWGLQWQQQMLVALALVGAATVGLAHPAGRIVTIAAALAMCVMVPLLGHAAGETGRVLIHSMHVLAGGLWLGTLAAIVTARAASIRQLRPQLLRAFAPLAMTSVAFLAATGAVATWSYLGPITNLWSTTYGRLLGVKLLLVLDALAIGGINWIQIHKRGRSPNPALALSEVVLAAAIVVATAWLTETGHP